MKGVNKTCGNNAKDGEQGIIAKPEGDKNNTVGKRNSTLFKNEKNKQILFIKFY